VTKFINSDALPTVRHTGSSAAAIWLDLHVETDRARPIKSAGDVWTTVRAGAADSFPDLTPHRTERLVPATSPMVPSGLTPRETSAVCNATRRGQHVGYIFRPGGDHSSRRGTLSAFIKIDLRIPFQHPLDPLTCKLEQFYYNLRNSLSSSLTLR
jgi:hypothetical protein